MTKKDMTQEELLALLGRLYVIELEFKAGWACPGEIIGLLGYDISRNDIL